MELDLRLAEVVPLHEDQPEVAPVRLKSDNWRNVGQLEKFSEIIKIGYCKFDVR